MKRFVALILCLCALGGSPVQAQNDVPKPGLRERRAFNKARKPILEKRAAKAAKAAKAGRKVRHGPKEVTSSKARSPIPKHGGAPFLAAVPATRPRRLGPGQNGLLMVVLSMQSNAVILPESQFRIAYERQQGPVSLGTWRRFPPAVGTLYDNFKNQPVYDDTAQVEIPISVASGAEFGKYAVQIKLTTVGHDGKTGKILPPYNRVINCQVVVGDPIPTPNVSVGAAAGVLPSREATGGANGEAGFALSADAPSSVAPGAEADFTVELVIPPGFYIKRETDMGLPKLVVTGLGRGLRAEIGAEPEPETTTEGDIYRDEYSRPVRLIVAGDAEPGVRRGTVALDYLGCDDAVCYPREQLKLDLEVEVAAPGRVDGAMQAAANAAEGPDTAPEELPDGFGAGPDSEAASADGMLWWLLGGIVVVFGGLVLVRSRGR